MTLTNSEYKLLNKIARKTKMSSAAAAVEKRGIYAIASELNKACSDLWYTKTRHIMPRTKVKIHFIIEIFCRQFVYEKLSDSILKFWRT